MRVLLVHNYYKEAGGEDRVFETEKKLLLDQGHKVDTLIFNNQARNVLGNILRLAGFIYNFRSAALIKKHITEFQPDVMHVHNFWYAASPSIFFMAHRLGIPVVVTLHNYRLICPSGTLYFKEKIYRESLKTIFPWSAVVNGVYRQSRMQTAAVVACMSLHNMYGTWKGKVDRFIVLTKFAQEIFESSQSQIATKQLLLKPNFVDDTGAGDKTRDNFFLFVGRLSHEKGIETLLKAAALHPFQLVIIGDGPLRNLVVSYTALHSNITYLGFLENVEVRAYLRKCRALVFPSLWYEGFPVTIVESFCAGTPVIASALGSMQEIIIDKREGLLFTAGDVNDLILKVTTLLENATMSGILGENARETYLAKFTPAHNYKMLMNIYESVVKKKETDSDAVPITNGKNRSGPRVSIGIPTYNGAQKIVRALHSVFDQQYQNLEIIISDNCSTDDTLEVTAALIPNHPEICYHRHAQNIGLVNNFQFCLSKATGKYFLWLSDDDMLEAGIIKQYVEFLEAHNDYAVVSGAVHYWKGMDRDFIERGFNIQHNSSIVRCLQYYGKVIYGGIFHGMVRTSLAKRISLMKVFGNDFHFVATLAYYGKIRNFNFAGYHKQLGGSSSDVRQCARALGAGTLGSRFPHLKVCADAFVNVTSQTAFKKLSPVIRYPMALGAFLCTFFCYYGKVMPLTIGGRIKRFWLKLLKIEDRGSIFKRRSFVN